MRHMQLDRHCPPCVRAKKQRTPSGCVAHGDTDAPTKFGDNLLLICDHIVAQSEEAMGLIGSPMRWES